MSLTVSYTVPESVVREYAQFFFDELASDYGDSVIGAYGDSVIDFINLNEKEFVTALANLPKFRSEMAMSFRDMGNNEDVRVFDRDDFIDAVWDFPVMQYIMSLLDDAIQDIKEMLEGPDRIPSYAAVENATNLLKKAGYRVTKI